MYWSLLYVDAFFLNCNIGKCVTQFKFTGEFNYFSYKQIMIHIKIFILSLNGLNVNNRKKT